jgi:hypothetical protein
MAACRVPDCQVTQAGVRPRPGIQIEDIGGIRIVLAGVPPRSAIGSAVRMTDPIRHAAVDEDAGACQSRMPVSGMRPELGHDVTVAGSAIADLQVSGSVEFRLVPAIQPGDVFAVCR